MILKSRFPLFCMILAASAMIFAGCGGDSGNGDQPAPKQQATPTPTPKPPERGGQVTLMLDQQRFKFELKDMLHYRQPGSRADMFEFICNGLRIVGKFPREFKPYESDIDAAYPWDTLVDQTLKIYDQTSIGKTEINLEGYNELKFVEGSLVIDNWKMVSDRPAIYGRMRLVLETESVNKTFSAQFKALVNFADTDDNGGSEQDRQAEEDLDVEASSEHDQGTTATETEDAE
ncbi:hypothetical protein JXA32_11830 [Candidatus Sumerlaeota bacterium]|nr:hypothetical protein [Candidatus Sumerlaeota bacterium]